MQVMSAADVGDLNLFRRGKVRDTFQLADGTLLMIATDRLSVFDVVLPTPIPGKGTVLTQMSRWWFAQTAGIMANHLLPDMEEAIPEAVRDDWLPRSMHVARAQRIDVECVVRGFISGSGWKEYRDQGTLAGESMPPGLRNSSRLPAPRFTPAIKKDDGHDINISRVELRTLLGQPLADQLESASLRLLCIRISIQSMRVPPEPSQDQESLLRLDLQDPNFQRHLVVGHNHFKNHIINII